LVQLLQFFMLEKGLGEGVVHPRFEPLMLDRPVTWKYRGQVVPRNKVITTELQITEVGEDSRGRYAIAEGWLWVDGKRIYHASNLGMRVVSGGGATSRSAVAPAEEVLDPRVDAWLADHCPTWTMPALPMVSMVDRLAAAARTDAQREVTSLHGVKVHRWLPFSSGPVRLQTEVSGAGEERTVSLLAWREATDPALSRFEPVASGTARFDALGPAPAPFARLDDAVLEPNPYESGALFHGPAFQYLTELRVGAKGSTATLRAELGRVPRGALHQGLLDAATHGIPHDALWRWSDQIPRDQVGYPYRMSSLRLYAPLPEAGALRLETRFAGFDDEPRFPAFEVQVLAGEQVLVAFRLVEILLPSGPIGSAPRDARRAFLRDRLPVPGVSLSDLIGDTTRLTGEAVRQSDWLPGNVARIFSVPPERRGALLAEVAVREHVGRKIGVHPATVACVAGGARASARPLSTFPLRIVEVGDVVTVADAAPPVQDLEPVRAYWRQRIAIGRWPVEDLYYGLVERFVGDVVLTDPEGFSKLRGQSALYVANHQVGVESLLFSMLASALSGTPTVTLAKAEHRTSWLGTLIAHNFGYPGVTDPRVITFFDRDDKESLLRIVGELGEEMRTRGKSVMVHVEGTRALACRQPVLKMSSAFIDMALAVGAPIVPVRFVGGLPVASLSTRLEFPVGFGRQDYWIGSPLWPAQLKALPLKSRKSAVITAINSLGPPVMTETPSAGDATFADAVGAWITRTGATSEDAVLFTTLARLPSPGVEVQALCEAAQTGVLSLRPDARSQWLGRLARRLYGPQGPRILGLNEAE
jgi:1-acyl-sn-glycerol-3-phosphate acyltransferase